MVDRMRIASLVLPGMINTLYRSLIPMQALAHRGHTVHIEEREDVRDPNALLEFDVVHFWRCFHPPMRRLAQQLRAAGVGVVWDDDADFSLIPPEIAEASAAGIRGQAILTNLVAMMRSADLVTAPSEALAERHHRASGTEARVLGNYLPPTFVRPERVMPHTGVNIGWIAATDRLTDYEELGVRAALERLLVRHQHVNLVGIGVDLGIKSHRYLFRGGYSYGELPRQMSHIDIGLAPLRDIPFNQIRSDVKLKEYAAIGVPWLASPIGPYVEMGDAQGGRLVDGDRWYEELEALVGDRDERARLARRGRVWAQGQTIEQHVGDWERAFEDAIEHARALAGVG
jgi:glycosyltransferase involved in cell wall biosynthesis